LVSSQIVNAYRYGLYAQNTVNADGGDWFVSGTFFTAGGNSAVAAINIEGTGGGKIINDKIVLGLTTSYRFTNGIRMNPNASTSEQLLITGNDIDQLQGSPINLVSSIPYTTIEGTFLSIATGSFPVIAVTNPNSLIVVGNTFKE
jgi:outer membrane protein W